MAYRDDLDAFARHRARADEEAALLASFRQGERTRRTRALATWLGGLALTCVIYGAALATPAGSHRRHVAPTASRESIAEHAAAEHRACVRRAMEAYLRSL